MSFATHTIDGCVTFPANCDQMGGNALPASHNNDDDLQNHDRQLSRRMQIVGVRFGQQQRELIRDEAKAEGISESQFIRDAAYARAVVMAARRKQAIPRLVDALLSLSADLDSDDRSHLMDLLSEAVDQ